MARKLKSMERDFWFDLNTDVEISTQGIAFVDLAQVASLVNRVSLRQGMEYVVESIEFVTNGSLDAYVFRVPEHWPLLNAWEKAFHHWKGQQDENARAAGLESTVARYRDFKVHMNQLHTDTGAANNLLPIGYETSFAVSPTEEYDWNMSEVVMPSAGGSNPPTTAYMHLLGADDAATPQGSSTVGLIQAYAESRVRPHVDDPNIVDVSGEYTLYGAMEDVAEVMTDVVANLQDENDSPPYVLDSDSAHEFYPGGSNQGRFTIAGSNFFDGQLEGICTINAINTNFGSSIMPGFVAPCGLLGISYRASGLTPIPSPYQPGDPYLSLGMRITLAPGGYKGLLAQSMQEAN